MRIALATYRALPQLSEDDRLAAKELRAQGVMAESAVWDSPLVDWGHYDAVVVRSTWDYHLRRAEFERWLAQLDTAGAVVFNPTSLIRWNIDKHYLGDLASRGVRVAETMFLERGESTLGELVAQLPWADVVIKPTVSASGYETRRITAPTAAAHAEWFSLIHARGDLMIQPFFDEVVAHGEWSLVFFAGQYSHAVRKVAAPGEFKVQHEHGGTLSAEQPRGALVEQAEGVTTLLPEGWLYARIDGFEREGELIVSEVELIEPSLFLRQHPSAPRRFAAAIRHAAAGRRTPLQFTPRSVTPPPGTIGL
jgi:glutathione synthase/RimK-type ligase-like ATP-grasp enzyme